MRNPHGDNDLDNITGDISEPSISGYSRRTKKRKSKSKRVRKRHYTSKRRSKNTPKRKTVSKGKRKYPHWLKKYWFKKKKL
jgi:hypothetical protein